MTAATTPKSSQPKIVYDTRAEIEKLLDDRDGYLSLLQAKLKVLEWSVFKLIITAGFGLALPVWTVSNIQDSQELRLFNLGVSGLGVAAATVAKKNCRKFQEMDRRVYAEQTSLARLKNSLNDAEEYGFDLFLQDRISQLMPQPPQPVVQQGGRKLIEWAPEAHVIQQIFKKYNAPVTVNEKEMMGAKIFYTISPTNGVDPEEIIKVGKTDKFKTSMLIAGYEEATVFAVVGRLILQVKNPFYSPQPVRMPVQTQQREPEPVAVQEGQPQPQQYQQQVEQQSVQQPQAPDVSNIQMESVAWGGNKAASMFPTEDVAQAMAQTTADVNAATSIFILAPRGCGKTGLLQTAMYKTFQLWKGKVDFFVWAGKDDEMYCGIENDSDRYIYSGTKENAIESVERIEELCSKRTAKGLGYPTIFVKDENNNTIRACKGFDRVDRVTPKFKALPRMCEADYEVVTKGRAKLCLNWMTTHTPREEDTGQSTGVFANVASVVLGRTAKGSPMYGMIQECLTGADSNRVVDDKERRNELYQQFLEYRRRLNDGKEDGSRALCLTNVGGKWRLVLIPVYEKDIYTIDYNKSTVEPADDPYEEFDEEFEDKHGFDPDEVIEPESDADDELEGNDPYTAICDWIQSNHPDKYGDPRFPDDATLNELWIKWFSQNGRNVQPLKSQALLDLRKLINAKREIK